MAQQARTAQEPKKEAPPEVEKKLEKKPEAKPEVKEQEKPKFHFQVLADHRARWSDSEHWKNVEVGHAWVRLINPIGLADSWGYWPAEEVPVGAPWTSVRGEVRHPDEERMPAGQTISDLEHATFEIDQAAADRVMKAASNRVTDPGQYNLLKSQLREFRPGDGRSSSTNSPCFTVSSMAWT